MLKTIVRRYFVRQHQKKFANLNDFYNKYGLIPIREGEHKVTPPQIVPSHIPRPDYINNPNPVYGIYNGIPTTHDKQTIQNLREAANLAAKTLTYAISIVQEGMTTDDIDKLVHKFIIDNDAYPSAIGFMNFPKSLCTSVNDVVCHGIPDLRPLRKGDSVNLDITVFYKGVHGDTSGMACVGQTHPDIKKLIDTTQKSLYESIKICGPGVPFREIGRVIEEIAEKDGFTVCDMFTGHGIGSIMHTPPVIYHHVNDYPYRMLPGSVFTIEPILLLHTGSYQMWKDNFTVVSPGNVSAQWEHMILITDNGYEVLTVREGEQLNKTINQQNTIQINF